MANSHTGTSTQNTPGGQYQVFLSFCGSDTRRTFANTVYYALLNARIHVFIDEEELERGERISSNLPRAIDDSKIYIPIFSTNYASRHWCLRELAKMVENTAKSKEDGDNYSKKVIIPIFYNVTPDDVKLNTPMYSDVISSLEEMMMGQRKKFDSDDIASWRQALKNVGGISGLELKNFTGDGHLSESVVEEVVRKLQTRQRKVTGDLVGMEDRIAAINNLLNMDSSDVRLIGICGMGGMGKTTLAQIIFNQLCPHFEKNCSFLDDVREMAKSKGLNKLQEQLLFDISYSRGARNIVDTDDGIKAIGETIRSKKVLIVLDDVDHCDQIRNLIGEKPLCSGTRIIVTTRDKNILNIRGFKYEIMPYDMEGLSNKDALQLFSRHAFDVNSPPPDYFSLSEDIVSTAGGLPLALQAIGASLFGQKEKKIWEEMLEELTKIPHDDVLRMLEITYDTLKPGQKQIFLDVACLFIGSDKTNPIYMWKDCGFGPEYGIGVLINRCMIKVLPNNMFWMHDQFRDLGRAISSRERSRLWAADDIIRELRSTEINKSVQALYWEDLPLKEVDRGITVTSEQIKRFPHLRLLRLDGVTYQGDFTGCLSELKWMEFSYDCSSSFTASNVKPENVVVMEISGHGVREDAVISLVEGAKNLKALTLSHIESLHRTPTFSHDSVLEKLTFHSCTYLNEIDCSIGKLRWLTHLIIYLNEELEKLPEPIGKLKNLQHLSLRSCERLRELPDSVSKLKSLTNLNVESTGITGLPDSIDRLQSLSSLNLYNCHQIQKLPKLPGSLTTLRLRCRSLQTVPDLSNLTNLVELLLSDASDEHGKSNIIQPCNLPWIGGLSKLRKLDLCLLDVHTTSTGWASLTLLEELTLKGLDLQKLEQLPSNLRVLELDNIQVEQVELDELHQLEKLTIGRCEPVKRLSIPSSLRKLRDAKVSSCNKLVGVQFLGVLESMEILSIRECKSLERLVCLSSEEEEAGWNELQGRELSEGGRRVSLVSSSLKMLRTLSLTWCPELQEIQFVSALESLIEFCVRGNKSLKRIGGLSNLKNLKKLVIEDHDGLQVVEGNDGLERLEELNVGRCRSMEKIIFGRASLEGLVCLPSSDEEAGWNEPQARKLSDGGRRVSLVSSSLMMLRILTLTSCPELQEIQFVSALESLKKFDVGGCVSLTGIGGLSNLKNLEELEFDRCERLRVVEGIGELERLRQLRFYRCRSMGKIIDASSSIPNECRIHITDCGQLPNSHDHCRGRHRSFALEGKWKGYRKKIPNASTQASDSGPSKQEDDEDDEDDYDHCNHDEDEGEDEDDNDESEDDDDQEKDYDSEDDDVHEILPSSHVSPPVCSVGDNDADNDVNMKDESKGDGDKDRMRMRQRGTMKKLKRREFCSCLGCLHVFIPWIMTANEEDEEESDDGEANRR